LLINTILSITVRIDNVVDRRAVENDHHGADASA
jgi:hypothetical protein